MSKQLVTNFAIKINSPQEMITVRETLRAVGYRIQHPLNDAKCMDDRQYIVCDSRGVFREYDPFIDSRRKQETLEQLLARIFEVVPPKTPAQLELEKLEEQAEVLNKQIAALKVTLA